MTRQNILLITGLFLIALFSISLVSAGCEGFKSCHRDGILDSGVLNTFQQDGKNYVTVYADSCVRSANSQTPFDVCHVSIKPFVSFSWVNTNNFISALNPAPQIKSYLTFNNVVDFRNATYLGMDSRCEATSPYTNSLYRFTYTFEYNQTGVFPLYVYTLGANPLYNCKDDLGSYDDETISLTIQNPPAPTPTCSQNSNCGTNGFTGDKFCQNSNVYQNYRTFTCNSPGTSSSTCSNNTQVQLVETCSNGCTAGECNSPSPSPLIISNLTAINITNSSAIITWNTNRAANSTVSFMTCSSSGSASDISMVLFHSLNLINLTPTTEYCITATSCDSLGCASANGCLNTTNTSTPITPSMSIPNTISNLHLISHTNTTITWGWTNPTDSFSGTIVFLNNNNLVNLTGNTNTYTAQNLVPGTFYTINVHTYGPNGINNTDVTDTKSTLSNNNGDNSTNNTIIIHHTTNTQSQLVFPSLQVDEAVTTTHPAGQVIGNLTLIPNEQANNISGFWLFFWLMLFLILLLIILILLLIYGRD
jgi:hypothetical protein